MKEGVGFNPYVDLILHLLTRHWHTVEANGLHRRVEVYFGQKNGDTVSNKIKESIRLAGIPKMLYTYAWDYALDESYSR